MKEDLRSGGNAIEQKSYDVSYHIMIFDNAGASTHGSSAEDTVDEFFEKMRATRHVRFQTPADTILGLLEQESQTDVEDAINEILHQIKGKLKIEGKSGDQNPALRHTLVEYHPDTQGGFFELQGPSESEDYIYEFHDTLVEAGLDAEINENFR